MHMALAADDRFKDCDYRKMDTLGVSVQEGLSRTSLDLPEWLNGSIGKSSCLGDKNTTAQVHPYKLTHTFFRLAKEIAGSERREGVVEGVLQDGEKIIGVRVNGEVIPTDVVVIAMGPWSGAALRWFNLPAITGRRAHSIVLQPSQPISAHACFLEYTSKSGKSRDSPEAYPRPDGSVYVCGKSDTEELPNDPKDVQYNSECCKELRYMAGVMSTALKEADLQVEQACYLPSSPDGLPLIGRIPNTPNGFVATGHTCWGILNAPATGEAMAQLVVDGTCSMLDLSPFNPARLLQ